MSTNSKETAIEINTLEDILFMEMMNDISFTVDDKIVVLIEHQASISEKVWRHGADCASFEYKCRT